MKNFTLFVLCCLLYFSAFAQNKTYLIHPAYTDQVIAELKYIPAVYRVGHNTLSTTYLEDATLEDEKILVQKKLDKNGSFVLEAKTDIKTLLGSFEAIGTYWVIDEDYGVFLNGGLINSSIMQPSDLSTIPRQVENCNVLIRNNKNEYYLVQSDFLEMIGSAPLNKKTSGNIVRKKSLERITSITYTIEEYQSMIERCKELTANLIVHGRMAKKGAMNKKQLQNWKTDLEEAKKLSKEIALFKSIYDTKGSPLSTTLKQETTENYKDFSKVITESSKGLSL